MNKAIAEREINLFDMLWAVCQKWRSILAAAVIFAVLAGGFSYVKSAQAAKVEKAEVTSETVAENLTAAEKNAADVYVDYLQIYKEQQMYNKTAPIMQLDASAFYKGEISYYVDNYYEVEYPIIEKNNNILAIINAYKAGLNNEDMAQQVREILGTGEDNSYVMELIDSNNVYNTSIEFEEEKGLLTIFVYAPDADICSQLMNVVKENIEKHKQDVKSSFGAHDMTLIQDNYQYTSDSEILAYQKLNIDKLQSFVTNQTNLFAKFNDVQKNYIALCEQKAKASVETEERVVTTPTVSKKLIVLGFLAGAFLMFALWALVYILSNKLRLEDDFEQIFDSKLLGNVPVNDKKKKWFGFIDKLFEKLRHFNQRYFETEEALDMVAANIRIAMQRADAKRVMITGAVSGEEEKKVAEALADRLKKDGIEIVCESPVLYNAESLEKLVATGYVVLVEKAEKSLYQEVAREIEICKQQEVNLIGSVVVY